MRDEEFVKKYEELLDKGYCDCNEMNCIDNNSPRRILNIAKRLQLEEDDLLKENRELRKKLEKSFSYEEYDYQVNRNIELRKENKHLRENWEYLKEWLDNLIKETDKPVSKLLFKSVLSNIKKIEKSDK